MVSHVYFVAGMIHWRKQENGSMGMYLLTIGATMFLCGYIWIGPERHVPDKLLQGKLGQNEVPLPVYHSRYAPHLHRHHTLNPSDYRIAVSFTPRFSA